MSMAPEVFAAGPAVVGAFIYALKRLSAVDLEMRANRERERARYLLERRRREEIQTGILTPTASDEKITQRQLKETVGQLDQYAARAASDDKQFYDTLTPRELEVLAPGVSKVSEREPDDSEVTHELAPIKAGSGRLRRPRTLAEWLNPTGRRVRPEVPAWALALLAPEEAERCVAGEWAAHLHERIQEPGYTALVGRFRPVREQE